MKKEVREKVRECWRAEVTAHAAAYPFAQTEMGLVPGGHVVAIGDGATENVSEGCCREFVRMWVFARNSPGAFDNLPPSPLAEEFGWAETPELRLVRKHMTTIMVAQALVQAKVTKATADVAGLVRKHQAIGVTADKLADKYLWDEGGALIYADVEVGDGDGHALGFDTRGGEFHFFDPECAVFSCTDAAGQKAGIVKFVKKYYKYAGYTGNIFIRYARV